MYIVLNYDLNIDKSDKPIYHKIRINQKERVICNSFDIAELSKILSKNYVLGDDIHVYYIESLESTRDNDTDTITHSFYIQSEVEFRILKESSQRKNINDFMVYRLCSTVDELITQQKWDKCIEGLINSSDLKHLIKVYTYLNENYNKPKYSTDISNTIERIQEKVLTKLFDNNCIDIVDVVEFLNRENCSLILSKLKLHIYSEDTNFNVLEHDIDVISTSSKISLLCPLFRDYTDKAILIYFYCDANKKESFLRCQLFLKKIIDILDKNNLDSSIITEKYTFFLNHKKWLLF